MYFNTLKKIIGNTLDLKNVKQVCFVIYLNFFNKLTITFVCWICKTVFCRILLDLSPLYLPVVRKTSEQPTILYPNSQYFIHRR